VGLAGVLSASQIHGSSFWTYTTSIIFNWSSTLDILFLCSVFSHGHYSCKIFFLVGADWVWAFGKIGAWWVGSIVFDFGVTRGKSLCCECEVREDKLLHGLAALVNIRLRGWLCDAKSN
jgi:hypothetical protein